jgi:hypothetical protein
MTDERHRLPGLIDLARQLQHLVESAQLIGSKAAGDHQPVEVPSFDLIDARVDGHRITALPLIRFLADPGDDRSYAFFFEPDLGIPQLQIFV